jgi:hypothetical protein
MVIKGDTLTATIKLQHNSLCGVLVGDTLLIGCFNGNLIFMKDNTVTHTIELKNHIFSLLAIDENTVIAG